MANIYMVRHGQSLANLEWKYQGQTNDTELTPLGKVQAESAAQKLLDKNIKVIFSSPLKRAKQTAEIISQILKLPMYFDKDLMETDHGNWSFLDDTQVKTRWPVTYEMWKTRPSQVVFPNGESFQDQTARRVIDWWQNLDKSKITVIVSHENIMQIVTTFILSQSLDRILEHRFKNGDVICINSDNIEIC